MRTQHLLIAAALVALVVALAVTGRSDYDDALQQQQDYCNHVRDGSWPAYNKRVRCS